MTDAQRYLAEEIALDCADGVIPRREALRRLALMGLSLSAASALLAACAQGSTGTTTSTSTAAPKAPTTGPPTTAGTAASATASTAAAGGNPVPTQEVRFAGPNGEIIAAWAPAASSKGGVLVIHENRGLTDYIKSVAGRLGGDGYSSLAIDLISEEGGTDKLGADVTPTLGKVPQDRFVADMTAGVTELQRRLPGKKLGMIGFCFGGMQVWELLAGTEPRLAAAVPFYGFYPSGADLSGSKAAVLAVYAELDQRVNGTRDAAVAAMTKAGLTHQEMTFPGVNHAFHNNTGPSYNAEQAAKAYQAALDWYGRYLAG